jgi:general secretion pathway protein I
VKKPLGQSGFTLLEIMIALAIIAVAFVSLLGLRNSDIVMHDRARAVIQATALAQQRLGDTVVGPFPELGSTEGRFDEENARYAWRQDVSPTPFEFAREVRVSVTWSPQQEERVDLVRYVFQKQAGR